jgi:hypothetical protein
LYGEFKNFPQNGPHTVLHKNSSTAYKFNLTFIYNLHGNGARKVLAESNSWASNENGSDGEVSSIKLINVDLKKSEYWSFTDSDTELAMRLATDPHRDLNCIATKKKSIMVDFSNSIMEHIHMLIKDSSTTHKNSSNQQSSRYHLQVWINWMVMQHSRVNSQWANTCKMHSCFALLSCCHFVSISCSWWVYLFFTPKIL